jgi:hypothetical protein
MAAPTDYFVDPSLSSDTGDGTVGTPWGRASAGTVIQYALDTGITRDATNGDRINIKSGTDEVLAATVSLATYGTPSVGAPLVFQGYTSAQGDLGVGGIDCNSSTMFASTAIDNIYLKDLHIHNSGSATLVAIDTGCSAINCEFNNTSGRGLDIDEGLVVENCYLHDIGEWGIFTNGDAMIRNNYFKNDGTNDFVRAIMLGSPGSIAIHNIISIDGGSIGIYASSGQCSILFNSVLSSSGTGEGIRANTHSDSVQGNLVEGFSGAGGDGISFGSSTHCRGFDWNAVYNNTTAYGTPEWIHSGGTDNETLGASPFAKSGSDTFANRFVYFAPVDTGNVIGGLPNGQDKGAVQGAGGTTTKLILTRPRRVM